VSLTVVRKSVGGAYRTSEVDLDEPEGRGT
jgi:hypothetical protein